MILFIDNKQNIPDKGRPTRFYSFLQILNENGIESSFIVGSWSHHFKRRIILDKTAVYYVNNFSYYGHVGLRRLFSELFFGYQVLYKYSKLLNKADVLVFNDSGIFYNYLFYFLKPFFGYKIMLDSFDLWPEIFFKSNFLKKITYNIKKMIFKKTDFFIAVNKDYSDYYKFLKGKSYGVIYLGSSKKVIKELACNIFDKSTKRLLYIGTFGVNYLIDEMCNFVISNPEWTLDCYGTGPKESVIKEYALNSNGRISVYGYVPLGEIIRNNNKYSFGVAIYSSNSLVKFPTKLIDYWTFSLPVLVNVGNEVEDLIVNCKELGLYLKNIEDFNNDNLVKYLNEYPNNSDEINFDFSIDERVLEVFKCVLNIKD